MRSIARITAWLPLVAAGLVPCLTHAQGFSADYQLTRPVLSGYADPDLLPRGVALVAGAVRIGPAFSSSASGAGLSIEAGQQWFGRLTVGRSVESDGMSLGGGYRWRDGESLSMQVTRGLASERLGLAVRYDWPRYYVRLGYEMRPRTGTADLLRFSAGIRF